MNNNFIIRLFSTFLFSTILICYSQILNAQEKDFVLWTGIELEKKISDKIRISIEEEFRFDQNATSLRKYFTDIGIKYNITSNIRVSGYYRFIQTKRLGDNYQTQHRYYFDLLLKKPLYGFNFSFRSRFQNRYLYDYEIKQGEFPRKYSRNRIGVKYNIPQNPITPVISYETFYFINRSTGGKFDKQRLKFGAEYQINETNQVELSYTFQKELNTASPLSSYILSIQYAKEF